MADFIVQEKPLFLGMDEWEAPIQPKGIITTRREEEDKQWLESNLSEEEITKAAKGFELSQEQITVDPMAYVGFDGLFSSALENQEPLEAIQNIGQKQAEFNQLVQKGESLSITDIENAKDPIVTANLFRYQHRLSKSQERLLDLAQEYEGGLADKVYEFLDNAVYDTYASFRDIKQGATGEGTEVSVFSDEWLTALTTLDDDAFNQWVDNRIATLADKTTREPSWQVYRELAAIEAAGFVLFDREWGYANSALAGFDIAAVGLKGGIALGRYGRSLVGRLRSSAGTKVATEAAIKTTGTDVAIRTGLDGEILDGQLALPDMNNRIEGTVGKGPKYTRPQSSFKINPNVADAEIVEDIIPSAYATKQSTNPTTPPPVSTGAINYNTIASNIKDAFLRAEARGSFGMSATAQNARDWATSFGEEVAKVSATKVIDFDLVDEGLQNFRAVWRLGKPGGETFTDFEVAKKLATQIENARVVDARTGKVAITDTGSGQYMIQFDKRYATKASPLDLGRVSDFGTTGSWLAKWFASSSRGSDSFFSNLADAAEYGSTKFRQDIKEVYNSFGKLTQAERDHITDILTYLRDDAKTNTWYATSDFIAQWKLGFGSLPRREVVQLYEDLVQASDFSWYVMASDRLRWMAKNNSLMFKYKDAEHVVVPISTKPSGKVFNASEGKLIDAKDVPEGIQVYKFAAPKNGWPKFVYNIHGQTRLPELTDAYPYNSGGPRINPEIQYFIGTADQGWQTALGAKTSKQASKAVEQINKINSAIQTVLRGSDPKNFLSKLSKADKQTLDSIVKQNVDWNPFIESIDDYVKFMEGRGVQIGQQVVYKERNARLETFIDLADDFLIGKNLSQYITYARHDLALVEFGGERAANPNPVQAIVNQFNMMIDQGARTQYRIEHIGAWAEAIWKYSNPQKGGEILQVEGLGPFTPETLARNVVIKGDTPLARKLRDEQSRIVRRLGMLEGSSSESNLWKGPRDFWTNQMNAALELAYNADSKWFPSAKVTPALRGLRDGVSGGLLSFGFMMKMASPFQIILQGSHVINISSVSPRNGFRGVLLAAYLRQMAAHPQGATLLGGLRKKLAQYTMKDEKELDDLINHFTTSGRGYMRGAVVEDPNALPGVKTAYDKVADILRAPYYMGENFSATVSRITAYLDTIDKHPKVRRDTQGFWNLVSQRDRVLSFALNKAQASSVQSDSITRVLTQWTSYFMRAFETILFEGNLTKLEKARLASAMTIFWGTSGLGISQYFSEGDEPSFTSQLIKYGPLDYVLNESLGVTVGDRIAINIPDLVTRGFGMVADPSGNVPAATIAGGAVGELFTKVLPNLFRGQGELAMYDLATLVRTFKAGDDMYMAYTMMMDDVRKSRTGTAVSADFTTFQAFAQAVGLRPSEVTQFNELSGKTFRQSARRARAVEKSVPIIKLAIKYGEAQDWERFNELITDASAMIDSYGLSPMYRADAVKQAMREADADRFERVLNQAVRAGYGKEVLNYKEGLE